MTIIHFCQVQDKIETVDAEKFCGLLACLIHEVTLPLSTLSTKSNESAPKTKLTSSCLEVDLELMWALLPRSVLKGVANGEATFNLTLMSSAIHLLKDVDVSTHTLLQIKTRLQMQPITRLQHGHKEW